MPIARMLARVEARDENPRSSSIVLITLGSRTRKPSAIMRRRTSLRVVGSPLAPGNIGRSSSMLAITARGSRTATGLFFGLALSASGGGGLSGMVLSRPSPRGGGAVEAMSGCFGATLASRIVYSVYCVYRRQLASENVGSRDMSTPIKPDAPATPSTASSRLKKPRKAAPKAKAATKAPDARKAAPKAAPKAKVARKVPDASKVTNQGTAKILRLVRKADALADMPQISIKKESVDKLLAALSAFDSALVDSLAKRVASSDGAVVSYAIFRGIVQIAAEAAVSSGFAK